MVKGASYLDGHVCSDSSVKWSDDTEHTGSSEEHNGSEGFIYEEGKAGR